MMQKRKTERGYGSATVAKTDLTGDFEIALAAMTSAEDFKSLEEQFGAQFVTGSKD